MKVCLTLLLLFFFFVQAAALWRLFTLFQRYGENLRRRGDAWVKPPRPSFVRMAFGRWWLSSAPGRREPVHHNTFFSLHLYADRYCCFSTCSTPPECFKCRFLGPRGFGGIFVATQNFLPYVTTQIFKQIWVQVRNKMWMCGGRALTVNLWIAKKKKNSTQTMKITSSDLEYIEHSERCKGIVRNLFIVNNRFL